MSPAPREDPRLARLTTICLGFPEATREISGEHATYRVRGKVFAYFLKNHHGDGVVSLCWKAAPGENRDWIRLDPRRFFMPAYIGPRGWAGLRLDLGRPDWTEVADFARDSYRLTAPKRLVKQLPPLPGAGR
jgi:predicted DNA-binding protein (MmcQ/YjbR family)